MVNEFDPAFDRLQHNVSALRAATEQPTVPPGEPFATTTHSSPDGMVGVTATDGRLAALDVDATFLRSTHPTRAWKLVVDTVNECLELNQAAMVARMREDNPTMQSLEKLVSDTRADFDHAFRSILSKI